jgi:cytochrome c oxidase cbb3-type subunit 1
MITVGSIYSMLPGLLGQARMYSIKAIDLHFWLHTVGVVFYISSMWIAGVMQGLMWRATNPDGTLTYSFVESLNATYPYYLGRLCGGLLALSGMLVMAWNVLRTWQAAAAVKPVPVLAPDPSSALA